MQRTITKKYLDFYEGEREKLGTQNTWAMESPSGMLRDYVLRGLEHVESTSKSDHVSKRESL